MEKKVVTRVLASSFCGMGLFCVYTMGRRLRLRQFKKAESDRGYAELKIGGERNDSI